MGKSSRDRAENHQNLARYWTDKADVFQAELEKNKLKADIDRAAPSRGVFIACAIASIIWLVIGAIIWIARSTQ